MSLTRVAAIVSFLAGAFLVSAAVGGLISRQLRAPTAEPVAAVSPSPGPLLPTGTPTPTLSPTPTPVTATPTATATATSNPTATPAATPSASPTTAILDPATAEQFASDLAAAIAAGDSAYLVDRLHPVTIERYGLRACRRYVNQNVAGDSVVWEIQDSRAEAWDYTTDEQTTSIDDAWAVTVRQPDADPEIRELHFAPSAGTWRWFTDCGDLL